MGTLVLPGDGADVFGGQAVDLQHVGLRGGDGDVRAEQQVAQPGRFRGADGDGVVGRLGDELVDGGVGDQPAPADDDQTGCGLGHFAHQVGGHEHGVPVGGEVFEHGAHPEHAFGVQAVDRFVQDHGLRVAQQRRRHAQPLAHAEGEPADPFAGDLLQADDVDHLGPPAAG